MMTVSLRDAIFDITGTIAITFMTNDFSTMWTPIDLDLLPLFNFHLAPRTVCHYRTPLVDPIDKNNRTLMRVGNYNIRILVYESVEMV